MKVFLDARRSFGGTERYARGVLAALSHALAREDLVAFGPSREASAGPVPLARGRAREGLGHVKRLAVDRWALPRAAARSAASVYHSLSAHVPKGLGVPAIATCFDLSPLERPETRPAGFMERYEREALLSGLTRAAHVVALTDSVADRLRERRLVAPERLSVVSPALPDFPGPRPLVAPHTAERFLLWVGTIEPRKDLATLLAAHARVYEERPVPLVVAGSYGWRQEALRRQLRAPSARVLWTGPVDDAQLAWLYARAAALVQVSLDEGYSYPVVEALSFGTPVVASDIPVHREVAGDAALYAAAGDVDAVADRLRQALDAPRGARHAEARLRLAALARRADVGALIAIQRGLGALGASRA